MSPRRLPELTAARILLIEDDPDDVVLIQAILAGVGAKRPRHAGSIADATRLIEEDDDVDLVLLDLTLPDSVGTRTVGAVLELTPEVPIVVLTGADDELGLACVSVGAQDYIAKGELRGPLLVRTMRYALARARDLAERRRLEREILEIRVREQRRIAHDLHDGLGQQLAGIALLGRALASKLARRGVPEVEEAERLAELIHQTIVESKDLARGLDPVTDDEGGLGAALDDLARSSERMFGVSCEVRTDRTVSIDREVATHLYRIAQEAISNAVRHGEAKRVVVELALGEARLVLSVEDDGNGFPAKPDAREGGSRGLGLRIMEHRARTIGGSLAVDRSAPAGGVLVTCSVGRDRIGLEG